MAANGWNGRRTLDHCSLITQCVKNGIGKPRQVNGKCDGYQKSYDDDEPCEHCGKCRLYSSYNEYNNDEMAENERLRYGY
ncbi:MAG: hypothetical protein UHN47_03795 [Lachnospiraceae bacterium]|nr:hypothetical protein [Lachnospiraceae bacterium]